MNRLRLLHSIGLTLILLSVFFYGSFYCKNFLDRAPELDFKKKYLEQSTEKLTAQLLMFNDKMALSQYYLLLMLTHFCSFHLVPDHEHDSEDEAEEEEHPTDFVDAKVRMASQRYMFAHSDEFFDLNQYYALMSLVLYFDPDNEFVRFFGMGFSINVPFTRGMCAVLEKAYSQKPQWSVAFDCGWLYFYILREYDNAKIWLTRAMSFPEAPKIVRGTYAVTCLLDKKYDLAIQSMKEQIQRTQDQNVIASLKKRIHWCESLSLLYRKAQEYQACYGKSVTELSDLVKTGLLGSIPEDFMGGGFYWDSTYQEPASRNTFDLHKTTLPTEYDELFPNKSADHAKVSDHESLL